MEQDKGSQLSLQPPCTLRHGAEDQLWLYNVESATQNFIVCGSPRAIGGEEGMLSPGGAASTEESRAQERT